MKTLKHFLLACGFVLVGTSVQAATPTERAGELKAWIQQCNDPDPQLRLAYLEAGIATKDVSVQRICIRLALENDDADIRNLGLRAALTTLDRLSFETTIPKPYAQALSDAEGNEKKMKKIRNWYFTNVWNFISDGLNFQIDSARLSSGASVWHPLASLAEPSDNYQGKATVVGSRVTWNGNVLFGNRPWACRMEARLKNGGSLEGSLKCRDFWPVKIKAKLL